MGQQSGIAVSCGVGRRRSSDLALLWLWYSPAAVAPIQPLAWELLYAVGAALKSKNKIKKKERKRERGRERGRKEGKKEKGHPRSLQTDWLTGLPASSPSSKGSAGGIHICPAT